MDLYLYKRTDGKSDTFYVGYLIPPELQAHIGRRYKQKSTGTENRREARLVAAQLVAQFERKFQVLYAELATVDADIGPVRAPAPCMALPEELMAGLCERWRANPLAAGFSNSLTPEST